MKTFIARKSVIIGLFFFLLCLVLGGQASAADGNVTITVGTGGAVTRSPAGTLVSGTKYSWANNTNVTFTITPDPGYLVADVLWNTVSAGAVTTLTKNIKNNDVYTLAVSFNKKPTISASYSSAPAGAPNGTLQSSLGTESPAGVWTVNPNTTPTFTINTPANWLLNTIRVDNAVTGTLITAAANSLACNTTSSTPQTCTFTYAVGTTDHIFHVALKPFDNPATVNPPQLAVTTSTVSVINTPCITDPDNTQNVIYSIYADAAGTTLLSSNGTGSFSGLSSNTDYWVRVSGQTYNRISSAWENQASPLVKTTTSVQNYTVDLSIALGSGTVMVNGSAVTPPETTGLASGQSITYLFIPASAPNEYVLSDVKVTDTATGVVTSYGPVSPFTIPNVTANKSVAVYFKRVWTIAVNPGANGAISPANPAKIVDGGSQTFTLLPANGYEVAQLVVDGADLGPSTSYTFTNVTADHTIAAVFAASGTGLGMSAYSITPPFIAGRVKPNLLLMLDNSSSMYDLAYTTPATYCLDHSYAAAQSYEGYFDQAEIYNYDLVNNKFTAGSAIPASCDYRTAYMCINASGAWPSMAVTSFKASGRFLNWLTASKFDVQKKVLTGGKFNTTYNVLEGESRGCVGRRFIKTIPAVADLTFSVRGPNAYDPDFISQSTQGGGTRIEIYVGTGATYNEAACTAAAAAWVDPGSIGTVQTITKACIGTGASALKGDAYNHTIHQCFWALTGDHSLANMNTLQGDCESIYGAYGSPSTITRENGADAVCSSVLTHADYGNGGGNTQGFLGRCATNVAGVWKFVKNAATDTCADTEVRDYCGSTHEFDVIDPSNAAAIELNTPVAVPSFIMDAGVNALGNVALTALVRVALSGQPTGIIQEFKDYITFGAMAFNQNGSGTECNDGVSNTTSNIKCAKSCSITTARQCYVTSDCPAGESCGLSTKTDGGRIISYNGYDIVGDHTSGLIKAIDDIQATSWTPWAEAYYNSIGYFSNRADMRLQTTDFDETKNPSALYCRFNNSLIISDGGSTGDQHSSVAALASRYNDGDGKTGACGGFSGSKDLDDLAWLARYRNIKTFSKSATSTDEPTKNNEYVTTYTVFTGATDATLGECNPQTLMNQTAINGGTVPYVADGSAAFRDAIFDAFTKVASQASSGTAASILNNSEGSGAILLQAIFYPSKAYENNTAVTWSGELINLWYFVDPFFTLSTIREDTDYTSGTHVMDISKDKRVQFYFDTETNQTMVKRYNFDGTTALADLNSDLTGGLKTLWTAGKKLWKRNISTTGTNPDPRIIYTTVDLKVLKNFSLANVDDLITPLNAEGADDTVKTAFAGKVISYVHGFDVCLDSSSPCTNKSRNRTVTITVDDKGTPVKTDDVNETHVWKLGDIISSTPKLQAGQPLQSYDQKPPLGYSDPTYKQFYSGTNYKNRGMVYVGGNDGMLHALKMGKIDIKTIGSQKATLEGVDLGREEWAFIPKHVMPYLKYLTLPEYNANHLYLVDGSNLLFDVSTKATIEDYWNETRTGTTWKTVLLGGMGLGGASKNFGAACTASIDSGTCVKTPFATQGFSSYFAIDVTNQDFNQDANNLLRAQPTLLWEFSHPDLGYTTSGPALVRLNAKMAAAPFSPEKDKNGRWFAVYASGPTGPIDTSNKQFKGKSDQNLKLFVVDIEKGPVVDSDPKKNGLWIIDTGIAEAFAGTISNNSVVDAETIQTFPIDSNTRQDDVIYIGYTKKAGDGTWSDGGVLRLVIPDSANPDVMDVSQWQTSRVVSGIGPVTTAVSKLMSKNNLYLFFGTGRFYFPQDDMGSQRRIAMVKEPCYPLKVAGVFSRSDIIDGCNETTAPPLTLSDLTSRNSASNDPVDKGWYIDLDPGERVVTDTVSTTSGTIFYTSFKPTTDPCGLGGKSYLWGVRYDTGGTIPTGAKNGKVLIQLSTGAFAELDLKTALSEKDGRRTAESSDLSFGKASADAGLFMTSAGLAPVKRILHIQERYK